MISVFRLISVVYFLFFASLSHAQFSYDGEYEAVVHKSYGAPFLGDQINVPFRKDLIVILTMEPLGNGVWLPRIKVQLSGIGENPVDAAEIVFKDVTSNNIVPEIGESILLEEGQAFPLVPSQSNQFDSPFWGFQRSQHFIALFLKSKYFELRVKRSHDGLWASSYVGLAGSTSSYQSYIWSIASDYSDAFLRQNPETGKVRREEGSLADAYSTGYGVLDGWSLEKDLPIGVSSQSLMDLSPDTYEESFTEVGELVTAIYSLRTQNDLLREIYEETGFLEQQKKANAIYRPLDKIWQDRVVNRNASAGHYTLSRMNVLGDSVSRLTVAMDHLDGVISSLENDFIPSVEGDLSEVTAKLEPHRQRLSQDALRFQALNQQLKDLQVNLVELDTLSEEYTAITASMTLPQPETPLIEGLDALRDTHTEQQQRQQQLDTLADMIDLMKQVQRPLRTLIPLGAKVFENYERDLSYSSQHTQLEIKRSQLAVAMEESQKRLPPALMADFQVVHEDVELRLREAGSNRQGPLNGEDELTLSRVLVRQVYDELDEVILALGPGFSSLICGGRHYSAYKEKYQGDRHCLSPYEIDDNFNMDHYFSQLSSAELNDLVGYFLPEGQSVDPWPESVTKYGFLQQALTAAVERPVSESTGPEENPVIFQTRMSQLWSTIQLLRWRIRFIKSGLAVESDLKIMTSMYLDAFQFELDSMETELNQPMRKTLAEIAELNQLRSDLLAQSAKDKDQYDEAVQPIVEDYIEPLQAMLLSTQSGTPWETEETIPSCQIPLAFTEECASQLFDLEEIAGAYRLAERQSLLVTAQIMAVSLAAAIRETQSQMSEVQTTMADFDGIQQKYLAVHGIAELESRQEQLQKELDRAKTELANAQDTHIRHGEQVDTWKKDLFKVADHLSESLYRLKIMSNELQPIWDSLQESCESIREISTERDRIQSKLWSLFSDEDRSYNSIGKNPACAIPDPQIFRSLP